MSDIYNTIKIDCDSKKVSMRAVDTSTKTDARFWLNNNLAFGITCFVNGTLFDFTNVAKLVLGIKPCNKSGEPLDTDEFDILKEVIVANIDTTLTVEEHAAGDVHATFNITATDISSTMTSGTKWLVVQAIDINGGYLTFFGGNLFCKNDASDGYASGESLIRIKAAVDAAETAEANALQYSTDAEGAAATASNYASQSDASKTAAETARTDAAASAASAENFANVSQDAANQSIQTAGVQALQISKLNDGSLYFTDTGYLVGSCSATAFATYPMSIVMTMTLANDFTLVTGKSCNLFSNITYNNAYYGFTARLSGTYNTLNTRLANKTFDILLSRLFGSAYSSQKISAGNYVIAMTITNPSSGNYTLTAQVNNGVAISTTATGVTDANAQSGSTSYAIFSHDEYQGANQPAMFLTIPCTLKNFRAFNFDILASDAPYTLSDYQNGKLLPPSLCNTTSAQRAMLALDNHTSGYQIRDLSGNAFHALAINNVLADKQNNPAVNNFALSWTSGSSVGAYVGGASSVLILPTDTLSTVKIKGDNATTANFKIGNATSATAYSSALSVSSAAWSSIDIDTSSAQALCITPVSALSAATNIKIIIEQRKTI